ncbi:hypothetical protein [Paenibacillus sp. SI8]|uniref:hypothetical protein n=1 Tax=unclassified Paenibacillus TaxID=185978 RepID=UPI0034650232
MNSLLLPKETVYYGRTLVLPDEFLINPQFEAFFIVDFSRKFDDPDLNKTPALVVQPLTKQDKYMLFKYQVVLGEVIISD